MISLSRDHSDDNDDGNDDDVYISECVRATVGQTRQDSVVGKGK